MHGPRCVGILRGGARGRGCPNALWSRPPATLRLAEGSLRTELARGRRKACHQARLSVGLFQPPRSRDQTQTLLLEPEHENSMKKSRRGLDLQLDGYDYGKPHVLVRIRF